MPRQKANLAVAVPVAAAEAMLPEPALSFTIPSIHNDAATLECRIYHPQSLSPNPRAPPWRKHAAVVAHPYAPLGGCYDDAVVETLAAVLLCQGFLVGTFNFRGAGHSTGKTSWTSKAERVDYMSFTAFVYYYVHYLDPFRPLASQPPTLPPNDEAAAAAAAAAPHKNEVAEAAEDLGKGDEEAAAAAPVLLLCGYSYGAMITKLVPPLDAILAPFAAPKTASAAADIRLRAQHLAEKQNLILASARAAALDTITAENISSSNSSTSSPHHHHYHRAAALGGLRVGGDEDKRRSQEHGRRSFSLDAEEKIRKGVAELMQRAKSHQHHHHLHHHNNTKKKKNKKQGQEQETGLEETAADAPHMVVEEEREPEPEPEPDTLLPVEGLLTPRVAYLLVSPPVGWATSLMTMNLGGFFGKKQPKLSPKSKDPKEGEKAVAMRAREEQASAEGGEGGEGGDRAARQERQKLLDNPTLAVYGDSDVFVAAKRFREWASKLQSAPGSKFRAHEVSTAGHFYVEEGTMQRLADAVRVFSGELLQPQLNPSSGT